MSYQGTRWNRMPRHLEQQIAADYERRRDDGTYWYSLDELCAMHRIGHWRLNRIRKSLGLHRYCKHRRPAHRVDALGEKESLPPEGLFYRCVCGGRATSPQGHPGCVRAA